MNSIKSFSLTADNAQFQTKSGKIVTITDNDTIDLIMSLIKEINYLEAEVEDFNIAYHEMMDRMANLP